MNRDVVAVLASIVCATGISAAQAAGRFVIGISGGTAAVDGVTKADPTVVTLPQAPTSISLNGLPFDDEDFSGKLFVRYELASRWGVDLAYWNLGKFENSDLLVSTSAALEVSQWTASAYYRIPLSAKFSLKGNLGVAYAGFKASGATGALSFGGRPTFIANPQLVVPNLFQLVPLSPAVRQDTYGGSVDPNYDVYAVDPYYIPLDSPDSETGFTWGIGVDWQATDHFGFELAYDQHRIKVQDVESLALALTYRF